MTCYRYSRECLYRPALYIVIMLIVSSFCRFADAGIREIINFNANWKFHKGGLENVPPVNIDESQWLSVYLPHDAAVGGEFTHERSTRANGWLPFGQGTYFKHFEIDSSLKGKKVFIQFDGVYRDSRVYVNGSFLGRNLNGYLGFEYDISGFLKYGEDNIIVVTYDNTTKDTSRWYTGEGIYRDVRLVITDNIYVPQYGTYITTPLVSAESSQIKVETEVLNELEAIANVKLITEIISQQGDKVAESISIAPVSSNETFKFTQEIEIANPELWSCDNPCLYTAKSLVYKDDALFDTYETVFGIRDIRMTPEKGLLLNGEKVIAKGGNMHHDLGCLGAAALEKGYERKLLLLKEMGCNSIRLSHNPHAPVLLDLADKLGMLVFNEAYDKWTSQYYGGVESFEQNWARDITSFMKRDRNHPSVYIWSMGNEVWKQRNGVDRKYERPEDHKDYGVSVYKKMAALAHQIDPSRKVTVALFPAREKFITEWDHWDDYEVFTSSKPSEMAFYADVVSWNYTENMFASDNDRFPQLMFIATETGTRKLSWLELDLERVIGHYYWTATDYLGESVWPTKVWGRAFLDITDEITPIGSIYQCFYDDDPVVHIWVHDKSGQLKEHFTVMDNKRWNWYPMNKSWNWQEGENVKVQVVSNTQEVELYLNGKLLGANSFEAGGLPYWDLDVSFGEGKLEAIGRNNGVIVAKSSLTTAVEPVAINLSSDIKVLKANGVDLAYVDVNIVDKYGNVVPDADREISFQVDGSAYLAGLANSDIFSDEPWAGNKKITRYGKCMLVLRSTDQIGNIKVKAISNGLADGKITLESK